MISTLWNVLILKSWSIEYILVNVSGAFGSNVYSWLIVDYYTKWELDSRDKSKSMSLQFTRHRSFIFCRLSVQFSRSVVSNSLWPHGLQHARPPLSNTNSRSLLKLMAIESVMASNHLIICHPLLLQPSIFSSIRVFSNKSALHIRWPKDWSFSFSINHSNKYSGLILFKMDWLDLLAVQGTLKSSPTQQFKSTNSSVLNFLYSPVLTSIHDYWKNHSLD